MEETETVIKGRGHKETVRGKNDGVRKKGETKVGRGERSSDESGERQ
jgi:hypothetical protein